MRAAGSVPRRAEGRLIRRYARMTAAHLASAPLVGVLAATLAIAASLASVAPGGSAREWTRFRGPNGTGIASGRGIPSEIGEGGWNWRVKLPGRGHSSPVVWESRLFVTSAEEEKGRRHLLCIDTRTGRTLWTVTDTHAPYHRHEYNSFASSTPCVDAQRVYVAWTTHERFTAAAYGHDGALAWKRDLGPYPTQHGGAASPIVLEGTLILTVEPEDADGFLIGLDTATGETRWRHPRPGGSFTPCATPVAWTGPGGRQQVLFASTTFGITSLDPRTGALCWETGRLFPQRTVGSLAEADGLLIATSGSGAGFRLAVAVKPPESGSGAPRVRWQISKGTSYVPTPIAHKGRVYFWGDGGVVLCVRATTGETVWQERVGGNWFGSPICVDGRLFAMSARGELVVVEASDTFRILGRTELGEPSHATPAVSDGVLYLRTESHLLSAGR